MADRLHIYVLGYPCIQGVVMLFNSLLSIVFAFSFASCNKDEDPASIEFSEQTTQNAENVETPTPSVDAPGLENGQVCQIDDFIFSGVKSVQAKNYHTVKVTWDLIPGIVNYLVFELSNGNFDLKKIISPSKNRVNIGNLVNRLSPYRFVVRALNEEGVLDQNINGIDIVLPQLPEFLNTHSFNFSGTHSFELLPSDQYFSKAKFSLSLWFKTTVAQNGKRMINFHRSGGGTAVNLSLDQSSLVFAYRDLSGTYKKMVAPFNYSDGQWHHLVGTYNGANYRLYIDGEKAVDKDDTFAGFGPHPVHIGAYDQGSYGYTGQLDQVSIWKSVLNAGNIRNMFKKGRQAHHFSFSNYQKIIDWFSLGELNETLEIQSMTSSNTGEVVGQGQPQNLIND